MLRYSVILFCGFLAALRLSGLMFSSPMKTRVTPARFALATKFGILWHSVSTWIRKRTIQAVFLPQLDDAVEDRFPVLVAGEIVVGDEEAVDAVSKFLRKMRSTSSGLRRRDFRPCTLMMVQNEHWNGQPRPASNVVTLPMVLRTELPGKNGVTASSSAGRSSM